MKRVNKYLNNNKNWVDWVWFFIFTLVGLVVPVTMWYLGFTTMDDSIIISMISTVVGFFGTIFLLQRNRIHVIFSVTGNALLGVVFWMNGIYAVALINWTITPILHAWGAYKWWKESNGEVIIEAKHLGFAKGMTMAFMLVATFGAIGSTLTFAPGGDPASYISWLDAAIGSMYIGAILMSVFMYKEQYWAWLIIDITSIIFFSLLVSGVGNSGKIQFWAVPTLALYGGYISSSVWGHYKWRKIK